MSQGPVSPASFPLSGHKLRNTVKAKQVKKCW